MPFCCVWASLWRLQTADFINQSEGVKREVDVVVGPPQQAQHEKNSVIKNKWVIDRKIITNIKIVVVFHPADIVMDSWFKINQKNVGFSLQ